MSSPAPLSARPRTRLAAVDGLRGIAVLLVLVHHFVELQLPREPGSWQAYLAAGLGLSFSGVDLFFVISGFLIGGILMDNREAGNFYQVFYVRRALRIIPLYYFFLAICWLLAAFAHGTTAPVDPLGSYLAFLSNFWMTARNSWDIAWPGLAWSLAVEEHFYLAFPLLVRLCPPALLLRLALASLLIAPLLRVGVLLVTPHFSIGAHVLAPCRMDSLAFGVLAAFAVRHVGIRRWLADHPRTPFVTGLATLPVLAYLVLTRARVGSLPMAAFGYTTLGGFYSAVLIAVLNRRPSWLSKFCELRVLVFIGGISYFIYLFQGIIGWLVFRAFGRDHIALASIGDVALVGLAMLALVAAGAASWYLFEARLISFGQRCSYLKA